MKKEHLSLRIPIELLCHIDAQSELSSLTRSEVINKILEKYFLKKDISFGFHGFDSDFKANQKNVKKHENVFDNSLNSCEVEMLLNLNSKKEPIFILSTLEDPGNIVWMNDAGKHFFEDTEYGFEDHMSNVTLKPLFFNQLSSSDFLIKECEILSKDGFPFISNIASFPLLGKKNLRFCVIDNIFDKRKNSFDKAILSFINLIRGFPLACLLVKSKKCVWGNLESECILRYSLHELKQKELPDFFIDKIKAQFFLDMLFENKGFNLTEMTTGWFNKDGKALDLRLIAAPIKELGEDSAVVFIRLEKNTSAPQKGLNLQV
jgi:hypothetical protein